MSMIQDATHLTIFCLPPHLALGQSQRDCVFQPRVARNELPWETNPEFHQPRRGCDLPILGLTQPRWG